MKPQNFEEKIVWYAILGTYGFYFTGTLFFAGVIVAYALFARLCIKLWAQDERTPLSQKIVIPWTVWIWAIGMLIEELALIFGHLTFNLGLVTIIKSSALWTTGWAVIGIAVLAGSLRIRPELVYRAICILCLQSIIIFPLFYLGFAFRINNGIVYPSPLESLSLGDLARVQVRFYGMDEGGLPRLTFFGSYVTVTGLAGNVFFFIVQQETNRKWRWLGIIGSLMLCIFPRARLAILCLVIVLTVTWLIRYVAKPLFLILSGFALVLSGFIAPTFLTYANALWNGIRDMREGSTNGRELITRVALYRFKNSPIWGHGLTNKGTQLLAHHPPIGTHNTIIGLLYVKGLVGLTAFLLPMIISLAQLTFRVMKDRLSGGLTFLGLQITLVMTIYSFGATIDSSAYLTWPGWVILGMALNKENQLLRERYLAEIHQTYQKYRYRIVERVGLQ
jgi:hypothetical protein